ncbi:hypothetical protein BDV59DRAFT_166344 [Aspergillus ambiguus]|uniref:uncharacterized protein n=1 Tax=Aspergillus ambiguus TaxID=176160 RepID=UPI003CCDAF81
MAVTRPSVSPRESLLSSPTSSGVSCHCKHEFWCSRRHDWLEDRTLRHEWLALGGRKPCGCLLKDDCLEDRWKQSELYLSQWVSGIMQAGHEIDWSPRPKKLGYIDPDQDRSSSIQQRVLQAAAAAGLTAPAPSQPVFERPCKDMRQMLATSGWDVRTSNIIRIRRRLPPIARSPGRSSLPNH